MNPAGEVGVPGQPGGPATVQYTTVNISTEPPKDNIIWSLCCLVYGNPFCLGLAALIHSVRARDRRVMGDVEGARQFSTTARRLNIIATALGGLMWLIIVIIYAVTASKASQAVSKNTYG